MAIESSTSHPTFTGNSGSSENRKITFSKEELLKYREQYKQNPLSKDVNNFLKNLARSRTHTVDKENFRKLSESWRRED